MKKALFWFLLIIGIAVSMTSCISFFISLKVHKMVVDESVPMDQTAIITFENDDDDGWFEVTEWNNDRNSKKLGEELYGKGGVWNNQKTQLTVPAGDNSFTFNAFYAPSKTTYKMNGVELRYYLEQGKKYKVEGKIRSLGLFKGYEFFVMIYDVSGKKDLLLKEWKLGGT